MVIVQGLPVERWLLGACYLTAPETPRKESWQSAGYLRQGQ